MVAIAKAPDGEKDRRGMERDCARRRVQPEVKKSERMAIGGLGWEWNHWRMGWRRADMAGMKLRARFGGTW
ncbi:hypothetical protein IEQ34_005337 [Dendrobium chrysotoxum]|uniref:Uncharacterized protein n=1 Tax=Dendrobium chrysotoxum TaxID=161865 RepID=A0AAV7HAS2_DENCH|nr:hypothetical protein IEQ34_005337 [Dendrobium chrysotoxum]